MTTLLLGGLLMAVGSFTQPAMTQASGAFDVTVKPTTPDDHSDGGALGRMTLDKVYHGGLEASAVGQMLTGMSASEKSSGVYVAVARVRGTVNGRKGTF